MANPFKNPPEDEALRKDLDLIKSRLEALERPKQVFIDREHEQAYHLRRELANAETNLRCAQAQIDGIQGWYDELRVAAAVCTFLIPWLLSMDIPDGSIWVVHDGNPIKPNYRVLSSHGDTVFFRDANAHDMYGGLIWSRNKFLSKFRRVS